MWLENWFERDSITTGHYRSIYRLRSCHPITFSCLEIFFYVHFFSWISQPQSSSKSGVKGAASMTWSFLESYAAAFVEMERGSNLEVRRVYALTTPTGLLPFLVLWFHGKLLLLAVGHLIDWEVGRNLHTLAFRLIFSPFPPLRLAQCRRAM